MRSVSCRVAAHVTDSLDDCGGGIGGGVELIYDILECGRWAEVAFLLKRGLDSQRERHNQM